MMIGWYKITTTSAHHEQRLGKSAIISIESIGFRYEW